MAPNSSYLTSERASAALNLLAEMEWIYPLADAIKQAGAANPEAWNGPARCAACFADANPKGDHKPGCRLVEVLRGVV